MKYLLLLSFLFTASLSALSYEAAIAKTKNPRKINKWVVNPDKILSKKQQAALNKQLTQLEKKHGIEFAVVLYRNLEVASVKHYTHLLFNRWGIGKKKKNNGLLFVLAIQQKGWAFETGYGLESVLPDSKQGTIARRHMIPHFRSGNFGLGVYEGIEKIIAFLSKQEPSAYVADTGTSSTVVETVPRRDYVELRNRFNIFEYLLIAAGLVIFGYYAWGLFRLRRMPNSAVKYNKLRSDFFLPLLGVSIYLTAVISWHYTNLFATFWNIVLVVIFMTGLLFLARRMIRRGRHQCENCGSLHMHMLGEREDDAHLEKGQRVEEQVGSKDYDVWQCDSCNHIQIDPYVMMSRYSNCEKCNYKTYKMTESKTISSPSYSSSGKGVRIYSCKNCNHTKKDYYTIPKLTRTTSSSSSSSSWSSSSSSSWSSSSSSSYSSSSSFGGGSSGGGGASGSW